MSGRMRLRSADRAVGRYVTRIAVALKLLAAFVAVTALSVFSPDARTQNCPANVPHLTGTWTVLPYQMPINPISANLLPNGKILIVAGSENDASNNSKGAQSYRAAVASEVLEIAPHDCMWNLHRFAA